MLINFNAAITDLDSKPIQDGEKELTLKILSTNALLAPGADDDKLSGDKKVERAVLAQKIHTKGTIDASAEEVSLLKELISKLYTPLAVMRAYELLDPKAEEK